MGHKRTRAGFLNTSSGQGQEFALRNDNMCIQLQKKILKVFSLCLSGCAIAKQNNLSRQSNVQCKLKKKKISKSIRLSRLKCSKPACQQRCKACIACWLTLFFLETTGSCRINCVMMHCPFKECVLILCLYVSTHEKHVNLKTIFK